MPAKTEITKFIKKQNSLSTLRYITCGSVDDGKSTLLGRMLYEAQLIFDDQVDSLVNDSKKIGTQGGEIDFALLVDGLSAEREQGITIDVAYRFFSTEKRKFIVADSPGHEQYTRNMVTAASNAELAIILIDARNGLMPQTKRHSFIADLMGIKNIIVAVNKMDLVDYSQQVFNDIKESYEKEILAKLNFSSIKFIPVSALVGDNITQNSKSMSWYRDDALMEYLEKVVIDNDSSKHLCLPVQHVNRPNLDFRGFSGTVSSGELNQGEAILVSGSSETAKVKQIFFGDKPVKKCSMGEAVTITLDKEIDISRGDLILSEGSDITSAKAYLTNIIWFDHNKCYSNRDFILKTANKQINCEVIKIKNKINVNNYEKIQAGYLEMNDISECEIALSEEIFMQPYTLNKTLGNFILIDKKSNLTVGAGTVNHPLRKSDNVHWQKTEITRTGREKILDQKAFVLWFTGLSGAGKSTIANLIEKKLFSINKLTYLLDGDNLRHGLNQDLGFKKEDRIENLRRVGEVSKILHDAGIIVIASFISPFAKDRERIRKLFPDEEFIEIFVEAKLDTLKSRDPKGLYKKALSGEIPNFTGISSDYEKPSCPEITLCTDEVSPEQAVDQIIKYLKKKNAI